MDAPAIVNDAAATPTTPAMIAFVRRRPN